LLGFISSIPFPWEGVLGNTRVGCNESESDLGPKYSEGKNVLCHSLNNTVAATPRILVPILEMYQNEDGTITVPQALRPHMNEQERIG
jgi:hypothetical protein